jgi:hypothetical protein
VDALARALRLDEAERTHLFNLASAANLSGPTAARRASRRSTKRTGVRHGVQRVLDLMNAPAYVRNGRMDVVAANPLGRALFADAFGAGATFNLARYLFLDPNAQDFVHEWEIVARAGVATLRAEAGRNAYDRGLADLIGQLCTRSEAFRIWWAADDAMSHHLATRTLRHAIAGDLQLTGEALHLPGAADAGLTIVTFTWEPGSPTEQAIIFLGSWSARNAPPKVADRPDSGGSAEK